MLTRYSTTIISTTDNKPISSGRLAFYDHITSDPKTAYSDEEGTINITNVVPADSYGRVECFLQGGIYDIQVRNAADSVLYTLTAVLISDSAVSTLTDIGRNLLVVETPASTKNVTVHSDGSVVLADAGGSAAWGSITGTLSSQTDLQTALNGKASSTANISIFTNDSGYLTSITSKSIKDLSDVYDSMSPTDGQVLTYDTTNGWQAETPSGGGGAVAYLYTDTPVANPSGTGAGSLIIGDAAVGNNGTNLVIIANSSSSATGTTTNTQVGNTLTSNGSYGVLLGYNLTSDGDFNINVGKGQDLDTGSENSSMFGVANYAIGADRCTIVGYQNNLTSTTNSSAFGNGNTINFDTATAIGYANTCDEAGTTVVGNSCWAETANTMAIGHLSGINGASATDGVALGNRALVSHANSMVIASSSANVSSSAASSIKLATSTTNYVEYVGGALKIVGTNAVFQLPSYTTAGRPTGISAGAQIFDSTLGYAVTYNGSVWKDGVGTTV